MLAEVYGGPNNASGNGYMYHYLLDEMMRRGQIGVSAAAKVLVDAQSGGTPMIVDPTCFFNFPLNGAFFPFSFLQTGVATPRCTSVWSLCWTGPPTLCVLLWRSGPC